MAQPVWVLSVDLQTKTATFQTGLADAARQARNSFGDIKADSEGMGRSVSGHMFEARHGVMLLGEEFGVHLPRALTAFIASVGPVGAAMEAAFPFLAIIVGATLLLQHLEKMRQAGLELTQDQIKFGTAVNNAFNALDEKLIHAQIKADELRKDHLGALRGELELIDKQSMSELVHSFEAIEKAADVVFKGLKTSWYQFSAGSAGAKNALDQFQTQYDSLLAQGKSGEATGLLTGTLHQAREVLNLQKQYADNQTLIGGTGNEDHNKKADYYKFEEAALALKKLGVGTTEKEVQAQQQLVAALEAQVGVESRVAQLKSMEKVDAKEDTHNKINTDASQAAEAAEQERKKRTEILQQTYTQEQNLIEEGERQKIDGTRTGSAERLKAIDEALQEERDRLAEDTGFYRSLLTERTNLVRQMAEEEARLKAEGAREEAANDEKMGLLGVAALKERFALANSAHRVSMQQQIQQETKIANDEYAIKMAAYQKELAGLDKNGKDYENKLRQLQNKEKQLTQQHENELTTIKEKAEIERNRRVLASENQFNDSIARGLTSSIMGHQGWAKMMASLGDEVVSGMIKNAIKSMLAADMTKERDAAHAARTAFNWCSGIGGPILGAALAAGAFTAVMAFQGGTDSVPGMGHGDIVPTMLEPGEGVVPGGVMDGLGKLVRSGGLDSGGTHYHVHGVTFAPHVQAFDAAGVDKVLEQHQDRFQKHFEHTLRKMNK